MILGKAVLFGLSSFLILALGACGGYSTLSVAVDGAIETTDPSNVVAGDSTSADQAANDYVASEATLTSLVGFLVTESEGDFKDYAGIDSDGVLTDYAYDESSSCYDSTSTQITDRGNGVFWVKDGDITTELRMARLDGNLILFRNEIDEAGRVVYPGTTSVDASDLQLC